MIIENIADWVLIVEHKTHAWVYSNSASKRILGYEPAELLGQTTLTSLILPPKAKEIIKESWGKLGREGFLSGIEVDLLHKMGRKITVNYSSGLIRNEKGEITHRIIIIRDISEIKELINGLETAKQKLEKNLLELQQMNELMTGRELRMAELKGEVTKLKEEIGKFKKRNHS